MDYLNDMSKYQESANEIKKSRLTYGTIAVQLSKKNTRFQYKIIKTGARAAEYENAGSLQTTCSESTAQSRSQNHWKATRASTISRSIFLIWDSLLPRKIFG